MRRAILEKQRKVEELKDLIKDKKTIMIANIEGVPASMMQKIRSSLRDKALIRVYKNVIIERALRDSGRGDLAGLLNYIEGHPSAIVLTDEDPVKIYKEIVSIYDFAPLRAGKPSPVDVILEPGPVPVPITALAEVKAAGIPVKSVKGAVRLEEEVTVVRKGEVVGEQVAKALDLMGVRPIKVYLRIVAAVSDGILFTEDVLSLKPEDVVEDVKRVSSYAFNLSYNARYPTPTTLPLFIAEARQRALNLAVNANIVTKEALPLILQKARGHAVSLSLRLPPEFQDESVKQIAQTVETSPQEEEGEKTGEEKEEKDNEGEATAGLASLFG